MPAVAILTLPGFNELDSFLALHLLNRADGVTAFLAGPSPQAVSLNGVATGISGTLADAARADAVLVGSGRQTREFAADPAFLGSLTLDPMRQLVASQCSGALILAKLGILTGLPVCTDNKTRPWIEALELKVVQETLLVTGNVATAGGCLSAQYLATWLMLRLVGEAETRRALDYVVPVGEAAEYTETLISRARAADPASLGVTAAA
ncbi:DJ-1/PfpI family protein [Thalassobaculum sp.]|uniref:DJ-1/PfpI family protein n=1 Tax=Thalassobaculum sp. TaxID=2022740 RepID=UPI0032ED5511